MKDKRSLYFIVGFFVFAILVIKLIKTDNKQISIPTERQFVSYEVLGDGCEWADITMTNESGSTEQHKVKLPWNYIMTLRRGQYLYISAQAGRNLHPGIPTQITTQIKINNLVVKKATSDGDYCIAAVGGNY